jgi:hypothetical protein
MHFLESSESLPVSKDQARHHDGHDYMPQKRQALELLSNLLESEPQLKVVRMKKHRA